MKKLPGRTPFRVLVSAVLSTRTQDSVTREAGRRLLAAASDPARLARLPAAAIEKLIYPVGFYRTKARLLVRLGARLSVLGRVPDTLDGLTSLPGVGRKVANIVLGQGFGRPAIAVDTHVHRISNRLGLVRTRRPEQTEAALEKVLPKRYWREWNRLIVAHGQTVCRPRCPRCAACPVARWCRRVGVTDESRYQIADRRSQNRRDF